MRLKAQVYKTMVKPVFGAETWAVKEEHVKKLEVAEMRCLQAISQRSDNAEENEKQKHKAGSEGGGIERKDQRKQTEMVRVQRKEEDEFA